MFPKIVVSQNGWFIMENPIKFMTWGGKKKPYFWKHPMFYQFVVTKKILSCKQAMKNTYGPNRTGVTAIPYKNRNVFWHMTSGIGQKQLVVLQALDISISESCDTSQSIRTM